MKFEEVKNVGKYFEKHLSYKGINLWKLSEAAMYNNFLKNPEKIKVFRIGLGFLEKHLIRWKGVREENEKDGRKEFLVVVNGLTQVNTIKPLFEKMDSLKLIKYDSPSENITKKILEKYNLPYSSIENYTNKLLKQKICSEKKWLKERWNLIKESL